MRIFLLRFILLATLSSSSFAQTLWIEPMCKSYDPNWPWTYHTAINCTKNDGTVVASEQFTRTHQKNELPNCVDIVVADVRVTMEIASQMQSRIPIEVAWCKPATPWRTR
jgi:hypothetical protein